ncbi:hypothetical protein AGDE_17074 [Angomonas deanei]|nr:hypothetical protein AGDE_17074 [Angomonas deanei]|eukprot:EPY15553.1 hypothetical protein AGDE_17074 [Angomonas deanei]
MQTTKITLLTVAVSLRDRKGQRPRRNGGYFYVIGVIVRPTPRGVVNIVNAAAWHHAERARKGRKGDTLRTIRVVAHTAHIIHTPAGRTTARGVKDLLIIIGIGIIGGSFAFSLVLVILVKHILLLIQQCSHEGETLGEGLNMRKGSFTIVINVTTGGRRVDGVQIRGGHGIKVGDGNGRKLFRFTSTTVHAYITIVIHTSIVIISIFCRRGHFFPFFVLLTFAFLIFLEESPMGGGAT